jgi:hypothetical protein
MNYTVNLKKEQIEDVLNKYIAYDLDFDFEEEYQRAFEDYDYTDDNVDKFKKRTISDLASKIEDGIDPNAFIDVDDRILLSFYNTTNEKRLSEISNEDLILVNYIRRLYETPEEEEINGGGKKSRKIKNRTSRKERKVKKSIKSRKAIKTRKSRR